MQELKNLILNIADIEEVKKSVLKELNSGTEPIKIINLISEALTEVGEKYEKGIYFLSELIMAGIIANEMAEILEPHFLKMKDSLPSKQKVIIGTVKGDIHDIGKNIVIMMLRIAGIEVIDLGVDVPNEKFIDFMMKKKPKILAMSALLTSTINEMKIVIEALKKEGLKDKVKIIIGGRPVTKEFADKIGADGFAENAVEAIEVFKKLLN